MFGYICKWLFLCERTQDTYVDRQKQQYIASANITKEFIQKKKNIVEEGSFGKPKSIHQKIATPPKNIH